ncbi:BTB/POZ domain-containing protein 6-A [Stomoxys calcitrans]|uniref:BTB/POZ domain-containing protein 6-A n=1 Tax=Stomoxys calcitrans TaxID=35570 RepID=UPI0027E2B8AA|nr:BTB/POZ domain-containing protein 6-A [Stomoxys calcitrans]
MKNFRRSDAMQKLFTSGLMSDCKFVVGPDNETAETIYGHKVFFVLVSPVFEEMFNGNFKESAKDAEIRIHDVEPRHFKNFCYMIYHNDDTIFRTLLVEDVVEIYMLSHKYLATAITACCIDYLEAQLPTMSVEDVIFMFQFTSRMKERALEKCVHSRIKLVELKNNQKLMELDSNDFYRLIVVLQEAKKTLELFSIIEFYFKNFSLERTLKFDQPPSKNDKEVDSQLPSNMSSAETLLKKCLKCLNFANVAATEFKSGPGKSSILSFEQKYFIFSHLGFGGNVVLE